MDVLVVGAGITGIYQLYRAARSRLLRAAARGRRRRRRYLVLEPLPGRPVRLRELHLRRTCSRKSCSTNGSGRSTSPSSPRPSATSTTWSTVSTSGATSGSAPRSPSAAFDETSATWTVVLGDGTELRARFLVAATGVLSVPYFPDVPGRDEFRGESYHTGPLAGDARRLRGQARRRHRYRVERRADHPRHRRRGRVAHRVPAHRELVHAAQQRTDHAPTEQARAARRLRSDPRDAEHVGAAGSSTAPHDRGAFDDSEDERRAFFEKMWNSPGFSKLIEQLHRPVVRPRRERGVVRLHRRRRSAASSKTPRPRRS